MSEPTKELPIDLAAAAVAQTLIDATAYPPTHCYDVATLTPRGVLAEREQILLRLCPTFYHTYRFLDVGASKGFFSLKAAWHSDWVLAVEPDAEALRAWAGVRPPNVRAWQGTFAELGLPASPEERFDLIWIGNAFHYVHREDPFGWVRRLAAWAKYRVVIEGPIGPECPDCKDWPAGKGGVVNWPAGSVPVEVEWLAEAASLGLHLVARADSVSYTPGRAVWYLQR